MVDVTVVQPSEMGTDFEFDTTAGKWKLSSTVNTGGVQADDIPKYQLVSVPAERKVKLFKWTGTTFDQSTATLVGESDITQLELGVDDVDIAGTVLTFTDKESNQTITFDTSSPITSILKANSQAISLSGDGKTGALTATLIIDPATNNLAKVSATGLMVDKNDVLAYINANLTFSATSTGNSIAITVGDATQTVTAVNSNTLTHDLANNQLKTAVNGVAATVATATLKNTAGTTLGAIIAP